jgi:hypothetical protein
MRAVIVVPGATDLAQLSGELQSVANEASKAGHQVRLVIGDEATSAGLQRAIADGPYDLVWLATDIGEAGFQLTDGVLPVAKFCQWLAMTQACDGVLNGCFSAQHVDEIQRHVDINLAATIKPEGVGDEEAAVSGAYMMRAYTKTLDLREACRQASAGGAVQYRFFPAPGRGFSMPQQQEQLSGQVEALVRALNGEWGQPGLLGDIRAIRQEFGEFRRENTEWRLKVEQQMQAQQAATQRLQERAPIAMSVRSIFLTLVLVLLAATTISFIIGRLAGV